MSKQETDILLLNDGAEGKEVIEIAVDSSTTFGIKPTKILTFKNLPVKKALQIFAFAGNQIKNGMKIYASQSVENTTYLSCCVVSTTTDGQMIATIVKIPKTLGGKKSQKSEKPPLQVMII